MACHKLTAALPCCLALKRQADHLGILSGDEFAIHHDMLRPIVSLAAGKGHSASFTFMRHAARLSLMEKSGIVHAEPQMRFAGQGLPH